MCKVYHSYYACGCETPDLVISRCETYLHRTPIQTCHEMIIKHPVRIAVVLSDSCQDPSSCDPACTALEMTKAERQAREPTENVFGRYITKEELDSLQKIKLLIKPEMRGAVGAVLGLDVLQSLAGSLTDALPKLDPLPDNEGNKEDGLAGFESMQGALPRTLHVPTGRLPRFSVPNGDLAGLYGA